jgi:hypothetical protein
VSKSKSIKKNSNKLPNINTLRNFTGKENGKKMPRVLIKLKLRRGKEMMRKWQGKRQEMVQKTKSLNRRKILPPPRNKSPGD